MTRNLYLGVDLFRLFEARSREEVRRIAGEMLADVERRPFPPRAAAIAGEIEAARPDVVGVQEAALVRTQRPGDFADDPSANASEVVVDFLEVLSAELAALGLDYEVAASVVTTDVEVPAEVEGGRVDVRITDRAALLVRRGAEVAEPRAETFEAAVEVPVDGTAVRIERGYCIAGVAVGGGEVTVATTHLESVSDDVRLRQARELHDVLPADRPAVLAGDVNSGPGTSRDVYEFLTGSFDDAHATLRPDEDGFTCCQAPDLRNERSQLSRRVDVVLAAGLRPIGVDRLGEDPRDRVVASVDGETVRLWPSDHAGVVATFEATEPTDDAEGTARSPTTGSSPPLTARQRGRPTTASRRERTTAPPMPGFGVVLTVAALLYAVLARRRD